MFGYNELADQIQHLNTRLSGRAEVETTKTLRFGHVIRSNEFETLTHRVSETERKTEASAVHASRLENDNQNLRTIVKSLLARIESLEGKLGLEYRPQVALAAHHEFIGKK